MRAHHYEDEYLDSLSAELKLEFYNVFGQKLKS